MPSPTFETIQAAVREYCRDFIRAQRGRGRSYTEIAKQLGVTHGWIIALEKGEASGTRGAGGKIEHQLAQLLHGGSVDNLRIAALNVRLGGLVVVEDNGLPVDITRPEPPNPRPRGPRSRKRR